MSNTVAIRFRGGLPGSGLDSSGLPKQGKQEVRGRITVTNYSGAEDLKPRDVGLTSIDFISLEITEPFTSTDPGDEMRFVGYSYQAQQFYCWTEGANGDRLSLGRTVDPVITFSAFGDSAHDVELL